MQPISVGFPKWDRSKSLRPISGLATDLAGNATDLNWRVGISHQRVLVPISSHETDLGSATDTKQVRPISLLGSDTREGTGCDQSCPSAIDRLSDRLQQRFWSFKRVRVRPTPPRDRSVAGCDRNQRLCDRSQSRLPQWFRQIANGDNGKNKINLNRSGTLQTGPKWSQSYGFWSEK